MMKVFFTLFLSHVFIHAATESKADDGDVSVGGGASDHSVVLFQSPAGDDFSVLHRMHRPSPGEVVGYTLEPDDEDDIFKTTPENEWIRLLEIAIGLLIDFNAVPGEVKQPIIVSIYGKALDFHKMIKANRPEVVIGLGRLPSLFMDFLQAINDKCSEARKHKSRLFTVAFSGSPDIETLHKKSMESRGYSYLRNLVTPERKAAFFEYLDSLGMAEITGKVYLVESTTSGAGLNGFMRILRQYYLEKGREFPSLTFVNLRSGYADRADEAFGVLKNEGGFSRFVRWL